MTSPATGGDDAKTLPDYAPIPRSAFGPALNANGYFVGQIDANLYWVTDSFYQSAFSPQKTASRCSMRHRPSGATCGASWTKSPWPTA